MDEKEVSVKLQLNTEAYESNIETALQKFNGFQKAISSAKIGFSTDQMKEATKVFSDIRKTAISEINKINNRTKALDKVNIKIDADISGAQARLNQLTELEKGSYGNARKEIVKEMSKLQNSIPKLQVRVEANKTEIDSLNQEYFKILNDIQNNPLEYDLESSSLIKFNTEVDNINNNLKRTGEGFEEVDKNVDKVAKKSGRLNLMGRILSQMKNQIALALNPLNYFRRAWNEIIMTDDSRLGATFQQIGTNILTFIKPAIEQVAMWILTLLKYINIFLKAVTGGKLDLFAKTAKSGKNAEKSAKNIQRLTAGFDEINDIGDKGGAEDTGASALSADEVKIDTGFAKKLEDFGGWINKNWKTILIAIAAGAVVFGLLSLAFKGVGSTVNPVATGFSNLLTGLGKAAKIIAILGGLALVIGQITNLLKTFADSGMSLTDVGLLLAEVFGAIAIGFVAIAASTKLMDWSGIAAAIVILGGFAIVLNSVSKLLKTFADTGMTVGDVGLLMVAIFTPLLVMMAAVAILGPMMTAGLIPFAAVMLIIMGFLAVLALTLPPILNAVGDFFVKIGPTMIAVLDKVYQIIDRILDSVDNLVNNLLAPILIPLFKSISGFISDMITNIKILLTKIGEFFSGVKDKVVGVFTKGGEIFKGLVDGISSVVKNVINAILKGINVVVALPFKTINGLLNTIRNVSFLGIAPFKGLWKQDVLPVPQIPLLNVGTNFVPQDMMAVIHQGEAVVPKKFNDREFFGNNTNNAETTALLNKVIDAIENIEINPYTTVKDVGKASVNYIKDTSRQLGRSVI